MFLFVYFVMHVLFSYKYNLILFCHLIDTSRYTKVQSYHLYYACCFAI